MIERRTLICALFVAAAAALASAALSTSLGLLVLTSFLIGMCSVMAQILIPLASDLVPPGEAGKTIGAMLSGVILGILLARTLSGTVSEHYGWRAMYFLASAMAVVFGLLLRFALPHIRKRSHLLTANSCAPLGRSFWRSPSSGRSRSLPGCFSLPSAPSGQLSSSSSDVRLITMVDKSPASSDWWVLSAPVSRLLPDASLIVAAPLRREYCAGDGPRRLRSSVGLGLHLWGLIAGIILLDAGAQGAQVANQTRVLGLRPEARNRINTVYMICYFGGGSLGSLVASYMWSRFQWNGVCLTGIGFMVIAWLVLMSRGPEPQSNPEPQMRQDHSSG